MTDVKRHAGAPTSHATQWKNIDWRKASRMVKRLQMRIAKAVKQGRWNKVKALQWTLTHSLHAKLLAVKKVTSNKGAQTPGVDREVWNTPAKKMRGACSLKRKAYKALPLRRREIPKANGKPRPLGIPTLKDRAMQALYLLALEPAAETTADPNSYGFRPYRACRDAVGQSFIVLSNRYAPRWILDADIKACFDGIDHTWLLNNIPMDKRMLKQWLKSGFIKNAKLFPTKSGTPQGGIVTAPTQSQTLSFQ